MHYLLSVVTMQAKTLVQIERGESLRECMGKIA